MSQQDDESVLLSIFKSGRRKLKVFYHKKVIVWDNTKPPSGESLASAFALLTVAFLEQETLPIENVIAVHNASRGSSNYSEHEPDPLVFIVHYAQRSQGRTWKYCRITFKHTDPAHVSSWVKTLQSDLQSMFYSFIIRNIYRCIR